MNAKPELASTATHPLFKQQGNLLLEMLHYRVRTFINLKTVRDCMSLDVRNDGLCDLAHFCAILDRPHRGAKLTIQYQLRSLYMHFGKSNLRVDGVEIH